MSACLTVLLLLSACTPVPSGPWSGQVGCSETNAGYELITTWDFDVVFSGSPDSPQLDGEVSADVSNMELSSGASTFEEWEGDITLVFEGERDRDELIMRPSSYELASCDILQEGEVTGDCSETGEGWLYADSWVYDRELVMIRGSSCGGTLYR